MKPFQQNGFAEPGHTCRVAAAAIVAHGRSSESDYLSEGIDGILRRRGNAVSVRGRDAFVSCRGARRRGILVMMSTVDWTFLLKSPRLPDIAAALNDRLHTESEARLRFYDEMSDGRKFEFMDGEIILHSPARNGHLTATLHLATFLAPYVRQHRLGEVRQGKCLCMFPRNDYEPDIVFFDVEKSAGFTPETMKFPIPDFVVEVLSDSTATHDRSVKFEDFEAHGVSEYWIIDAETETIDNTLSKMERFSCC